MHLDLAFLQRGVIVRTSTDTNQMSPTDYTKALAALITYVAKHQDATIEQIRGAAEAHTRDRDKAIELTADAIAARGSAKQRMVVFGHSLATGIVQRVRVAIGYSFINGNGDEDQDVGYRNFILPTGSVAALTAAQHYAEAIGIAKGESCEVIEFEGEAEGLEPFPA